MESGILTSVQESVDFVKIQYGRKGYEYMKTGQIAKSLAVDPKTITQWTDREEFAKFFSTDARGENRSQRDFNESDLLVLNTIRVLREEDNASWEDIEKSLGEGHRDHNLPPDALLVKSVAPVTQYAQLMTVQRELALTQQRIAELKDDIASERERSAILHDRINQLHEQIGGLKAQIAILKESERLR